MIIKEFLTKINTIIQGNCYDILKTFPDECIDAIITSPPYFAQRDYHTSPVIFGGNSKCNHIWEDYTLKLHSGRGDCQRSGKYSSQKIISDILIPNKICKICNAFFGELGLEPTISMFVNHLFDIFIEAKRVIKKEGTLWIVINDSYFGGGRNRGGDWEDMAVKQRSNRGTKYQDKAMLFQWGNELLKKTLCAIPARLIVKLIDEGGLLLRSEIIWQKDNQFPSSSTDRFTRNFEYLYLFAKSPKYYFKQQFEPYTAPLDRWGGNEVKAISNSAWDKETGQTSYRSRNLRPNPEGRNKRCVWSINTMQGKDINHYATFPPELIRTPIIAGCPEGGIILDPFMGAGTTAVVAKENNRNFIGIEINPEYIEIAKKRVYRALPENKIL